MEEKRIIAYTPVAVDDDETSIDWMELFKKLWAKRRLLIKAAVIGFVVGCIIALAQQHTYTVQVTLSPEMGTDSKASGLASLASSFLGGSISSSSDALNATLSSDIVASTPFLLDLCNIRVQTLDGKVDTTLAGYLDEQRGNIVSKVAHSPALLLKAIRDLMHSEVEPGEGDGRGPIFLSMEQSRLIEGLKKKIVKASVNKKTAITSITVTLDDPMVAAIVADSAVSMLQRHIINYRIAKAKEDCAYLETLCAERQAEYYEIQTRYAQYVDANRNIALQSVRIEQERLQNDMSLAFQIYSQVAQQMQMARATIQEAKPVFAVIEPAVVPQFPSSMSRKVIVILIVFLVVVGTAAWVLWGQTYLDLFRSKMREVNSEVQGSATQDAEDGKPDENPEPEPKPKQKAKGKAKEKSKS